MSSIDIYIVAWNEELLLPHTVAFYAARFQKSECRITLWDNESSDRTRDIAEELGLRVKPYSTNNKLEDIKLAEIKNEWWKGDGTARWVLVVDCDELLDVRPSDLKAYEQAHVNVVRARGVQMVSLEDTLDIRNLTTGLGCGDDAKMYCKAALFDRTAIKEINYAPGAHSDRPVALAGQRVVWAHDVGSVRRPDLFHVKYFSLEYLQQRAQMLSCRVSKVNRDNMFATQYFQENLKLIATEFEHLRSKLERKHERARKVIPRGWITLFER